MELETRCESELEKAEEHFQNEQKLVIQNAQIRQVKYSCRFIFSNFPYLNFSFRIHYAILIMNNM